MPYYQFTGPDGPYGSFETFHTDDNPTPFDDPAEPGWYWWSCFPGCLPDDGAFGPFVSEQEAIQDAQDGGVYERPAGTEEHTALD